MKKLLLYFVVAVAVVAGVLYLVNMQSGAPKSSPTPMPSLSRTPQSSSSATPSPKAAVHTVLIQNFAYGPASVTVKRGDVIVFKNMDSTVHTATSVTGAFDSGPIAVGAQFTLATATLTPGTYSYFCSLHPSMRGTIVIQ